MARAHKMNNPIFQVEKLKENWEKKETNPELLRGLQ